MTSKELERFCKGHLNMEGNFFWKRSLLVGPGGFVLRGINFDRTDHGTHLAYVQPFLHVALPPRGYLTIGYFERLKSGPWQDLWDLTDPGQSAELSLLLNETTIPYLRELSDAEKCIDVIERRTRTPCYDSGHVEDLSYYLIMSNEPARATQHLQECIEHLSSRSRALYDYEQERLERLKLILGLMEGDLRLAKEQFWAWWQVEVAKLRLGAFVDNVRMD